ncbi:MAG: hypothetical protein NVS1B11_04150 [Terriglobales bacterium]
MRKPLLSFLALAFSIVILAAATASADSGPQTAWNVFTLPNPVVTPAWRSYAPADCASSPDGCAQDNRFWEDWDFSVFASAIDTSFTAVASQGQYQAIMMLMPLGDTPTFWNNMKLMYQSAANHGVKLEVVLFPRWKYGAEWCYLYNTNAPSNYCPTVAGTTTAVAYQQLIKMMNFVQNLGGTCTSGSFNVPFAIWYGWNEFSPGYSVLNNFWQSLPTSGCNLQGAYITWLDTAFTGTPEVQQLQNYVVNQLKQQYWVNTELYSTAQIQQYDTTYAPYQTIITGYWGASDITSWAQGMCSQWKTALQPVRLGVWTFYDRDVSAIEEYRSYINKSMGVVGSICNSVTPDFSIVAAPSSITVDPGTNALSTVIISSVNGYSGTVNLSVNGLPLGITASFDRSSMAPPYDSSTLTLAISPAMAAGSYTFTITGSDSTGSPVHSTPVVLTVNVGGDS